MIKRVYIFRFAVIVTTLSLLIGGPCAAAARFTDARQDVIRVLELIDARLALMDDVAAWKWRQQLPIADPAREQRVLDTTVEQAARLGLDTAASRRVFELLIAMARAVQTNRFEQWRAQGFDRQGAILDLDRDIRPQLDALGTALLHALYFAAGEWPVNSSDSRSGSWSVNADEPIVTAWRTIATRAGIDASTVAQLRMELGNLAAPPAGKLAVIRQVKVLRIGTTGDYAPFSVERNGELQGLDIELGLSFAKCLGVEARFVRTSWPTLMKDLAQQRFDIALSGISRTPERLAQAKFSVGYHHDGKTAIALCVVRRRYDSLAKIDRPQVRVIVNPGGANERFVRQHIAKAKIAVYADNRTIFDELIAARADVMITDGVEIDLQTRRHPELCRTIAGTLTVSDKAAMLPRDSTLVAQIDGWLRAQLYNDVVRTELQRAMIAAP